MLKAGLTCLQAGKKAQHDVGVARCQLAQHFTRLLSSTGIDARYRSNPSLRSTHLQILVVT